MQEGTRIALKLLVLTGQCVSKVSQAPKSKINLAERIWSIPSELTKNQHHHRMPLPAACWTLIGRAMAISVRLIHLALSVAGEIAIGTRRGHAAD